MQRHVFFENEGSRLLGALHEPESGASETALVLLHGWAGYRIGAHKMFVKLARAAEAEGFTVLRFDFRGRGDSTGDASDTTLSTMISDTVAAIDWLKTNTNVKRIALVGDCSGSEVAIGACIHRPEIETMVLWSAPMVGGDRAESDRAKKAYVLRQYVRKLFMRKTWAKLFSGRLQLGMIRRALLRGGKGAGEEGAEDDLEIDWLTNFVGFAGEILFIYGAADPTASESVEHYKYLSGEAERDFNCRLIAGANHAFYSVAWERKVIALTVEWVKSGSLQSSPPHSEGPDSAAPAN